MPAGWRCEGWVAPGFEAVAEAFEQNFERHDERGAALAAVLDGEPVVDLWGGTTDPAGIAGWRSDTLQLVFSGAKGLVATCLLILLDRGELALEDRVCEHWPEFAANGKKAVSVAELISHRARLPGFRSPVSEDDLLDDRRLAALLAAQAQETDPRVRQTYHPLTFGWLCGELIRRVSGRSAGRFFAEEVAGPLGLEAWIGLPPALEPRVSTLAYSQGWLDNPLLCEPSLGDDGVLASIWTNPRLFPPDHIPWNEPRFHQAEIPAANAIGSARSIARLFGCLARGGELGGVRLVSPEAIALASQELSRFTDPYFERPSVYGAGFELQSEIRPLGPPPEAFGHTGAGGSVHAAWPRQRIGVSYVMNELRDEPPGEARVDRLLAPLHEAVTAAV